MTREEVIRIAQGLITDFKCESDTTVVDFCNTIIKALKQEPCEDIISRKEAIFALNDAQVEYDENYKGLGKAKEIIDNLPPIQPIRPKGEWINIRVIKAFHYDGEPRVKCSRCGNEEEWSSNYCPNCGADMRGGR